MWGQPLRGMRYCLLLYMKVNSTLRGFQIHSDLLFHTHNPHMCFPTAYPDLNPQEHVWEHARDQISHNHTYRRFETLLDDFETNFMDKYVPTGLYAF
jgi:hypothetical protein